MEVIDLRENTRMTMLPLTHTPTLTLRTEERQAYIGETDSDRGTEVQRCGARTPSFDLRRKGGEPNITYSCPGEGRDWAFRPTA